MDLSKEDYTLLSKYERQMHTATHAHYVTGVTKQLASDIITTYNKVFNMQKRVTTCTSCVLRCCEKLAPLYYAKQEELQLHEMERAKRKAKKKQESETSEKNVKQEEEETK